MVHFTDEGAPGIEILVDEIEDIAAVAEVRSFGSHEEGADIAVARLMDRFPQTIGEGCVDQVLWRIGEHDVAEAFVTLEANGFHGHFPFNVAMNAGGMAAIAPSPPSIAMTAPLM